ncbi:MAG: SRPBCC domain-containing protein [Ardenticatenaceae bacterium]|nr:SRPBCC domain-containing protein [Ardenticatenaceae bacterium]
MSDVQAKRRDGTAVTTKRMFSRETAVSIQIQADPVIVWALLVNSSDYPRWNTTILSLDGDIKAGNRIKLKSTLDENRTFNLKVKEFEPEKRLVWGDAMGNRVYTLQHSGANSTKFTMVEKIGGPFFPLFARFIPSFDASFEQFVADLKQEAEAIHLANN